MRAISRIAVLAVLTGAWSSSALAGGPVQPCCACIESFGQGTPSIPAFFCGYFSPNDKAAAEQRCDALSPVPDANTLTCTGGAAQMCRQNLADLDIACPASGAPTASPRTLGALAAALGLTGYLTLRRRAPRG